MHFLNQPLWTTDYPRSNYQGTVLGNLEDWPVSYKEVEQAFGCHLKEQPTWMKKHPLEWLKHGSRVDHKAAVLVLICEFLRLREATEQAGTRTSYLLRTGNALGDDFVQALMVIESEPGSLLRKIRNSLRSGEPKVRHREHTLAFSYEWLDDALYHLDQKMGREREERIWIDLDQDWGVQMGRQFGSAYQARIEAAQLDASTSQPAYMPGKRRGL